MDILVPIVVAVISGLCVAVPSIIATRSSNNVTQAVMQQKIDTLTEKVDKHNHLVERMYNLEEKEGIIEAKLDNIEEKINIYHGK